MDEQTGRMLRQVKTTLDEQVVQMDRDTAAALQSARRAALSRARRRRGDWATLWRVPALTAVAATLAALLLLPPLLQRQERSPGFLEDVEMLGAEQPEFFAEMDFYRWLELERPDAG